MWICNQFKLCISKFNFNKIFRHDFYFIAMHILYRIGLRIRFASYRNLIKPQISFKLFFKFKKKRGD